MLLAVSAMPSAPVSATFPSTCTAKLPSAVPTFFSKIAPVPSVNAASRAPRSRLPETSCKPMRVSTVTIPASVLVVLVKANAPVRLPTPVIASVPDEIATSSRRSPVAKSSATPPTVSFRIRPNVLIRTDAAADIETSGKPVRFAVPFATNAKPADVAERPCR